MKKNMKMKTITIYSKKNIIPFRLLNDDYNYQVIDKFTESHIKNYFNYKVGKELVDDIYIKLETKSLDLFFTQNEFLELKEVFNE